MDLFPKPNLRKRPKQFVTDCLIWFGLILLVIAICANKGYRKVSGIARRAYGLTQAR